MTPKYPDITVQLTGTDGNAFAVLGQVNSRLTPGGHSPGRARRLHGAGPRLELWLLAPDGHADRQRRVLHPNWRTSR